MPDITWMEGGELDTTNTALAAVYETATLQVDPASVSGGRFGTSKALSFLSTSTSILRKRSLSPVQWWSIVMSVNLHTPKDGIKLFTLETAADAEQCSLEIENPDNDASYGLILRGTGGAAIATLADDQIAPGWHTIELQVQIGATGSYELKVDGVSRFSGTGALNAAGGTTAEQIVFQGATQTTGGSEMFLIDDIVIKSGAAQGNAPFMGTQVVRTQLPDGDASPNEFTPDPATASHFENVNDQGTLVNIDSKVVRTPDASKKERWTYDDVGADITGNITGVILRTRTSLTAAGSKSYQTLHFDGSTETSNPSRSEISTTPSYSYDRYDVHPDTNPWSIANLNASRFGILTV